MKQSFREWKEKYGININYGVQNFHQQNNMNFQLNRFYHFGFITREDIERATPNIKTLADWSQQFLNLAQKAEAEGRFLNASFLYRTAEFYTDPTDPVNNLMYSKFIELFYKVFADEEIELAKVPYNNSYLHALSIKSSAKSKGTVVIHGGGDSYIEAFIVAGKYFSFAGYDVIMFDGPGQGTTLHKYKQKMTHEWEKPVKAVLDYYSVQDITLIGISLGGYLAPRAAVYEERIKRVVMFDLIGDFYQALIRIMPFPLSILVRSLMFLGAEQAFNRLLKAISKKPTFAGQFFEWWIIQSCFMWNVNSPYEVFDYMKKFNTLKISKQIKQDVLVMAGENDVYTPFFEKQMKALTNAKSVEGRIFTKEEEGHLHCQVGNILLALEYILEWIERKEY